MKGFILLNTSQLFLQINIILWHLVAMYTAYSKTSASKNNVWPQVNKLFWPAFFYLQQPTAYICRSMLLKTHKSKLARSRGERVKQTYLPMIWVDCRRYFYTHSGVYFSNMAFVRCVWRAVNPGETERGWLVGVVVVGSTKREEI